MGYFSALANFTHRGSSETPMRCTSMGKICEGFKVVSSTRFYLLQIQPLHITIEAEGWQDDQLLSMLAAKQRLQRQPLPE